MPVVEIERQILPLFGSPNQGARFYNPELPASEPFVPGHRTCAGCGPSSGGSLSLSSRLK